MSLLNERLNFTSLSSEWIVGIYHEFKWRDGSNEKCKRKQTNI